MVIKLKNVLGRCILSLSSILPATNSNFVFGQRAVRAWCAKLILQKCGKNVCIEKHAHFDASVCLGDSSGLGINCLVGAQTVIGKYVMMGPNVKIYTQNHETSRLDIPMCQQGAKPTAPVTIGDDVWIGESVIILPGSQIGNGVILGAGAVVRGKIPDNAIVIGNPAEVVGYRNERHKKYVSLSDNPI